MLLGFLLILAWIDWKKREIPLLFLGIFAGGGCLAGWLSETLQWKEMMGGLLVGGILLLGALASRGGIGAGDALAFCASGIYLGFWQVASTISVCNSAGTSRKTQDFPSARARAFGTGRLSEAKNGISSKIAPAGKIITHRLTAMTSTASSCHI